MAGLGWDADISTLALPGREHNRVPRLLGPRLPLRVPCAGGVSTGLEKTTARTVRTRASNRLSGSSDTAEMTSDLLGGIAILDPPACWQLTGQEEEIGAAVDGPMPRDLPDQLSSRPRDADIPHR
jgi:hypothetical protein